jgi:hypothetical protein
MVARFEAKLPLKKQNYGATKVKSQRTSRSWNRESTAAVGDGASRATTLHYVSAEREYKALDSGIANVSGTGAQKTKTRRKGRTRKGGGQGGKSKEEGLGVIRISAQPQIGGSVWNWT